MPACSSTSAATASCCCARSLATVACSARSARCNARRCRKNADAVPDRSVHDQAFGSRAHVARGRRRHQCKAPRHARGSAASPHRCGFTALRYRNACRASVTGKGVILSKMSSIERLPRVVAYSHGATSRQRTAGEPPVAGRPARECRCFHLPFRSRAPIERPNRLRLQATPRRKEFQVPGTGCVPGTGAARLGRRWRTQTGRPLPPTAPCRARARAGVEGGMPACG